MKGFVLKKWGELGAAMLGKIGLALIIGFSASEILANSTISARNLPAADKVMFFMGQSSDALHEYRVHVLAQDSTMPEPAGITLYTGLSIVGSGDYAGKPIGPPLASILGGARWGDGEHNLKKTLKEYPNAAISIGLDLKDNLYDKEDPRNCIQQPIRAIAATGEPDVKALTPRYHKLVDELIVALKETQRPVYLRIGYEFDGPWNCYSPEHYKTTFRYFKSRIDALDAQNIATVWQSASAPIDDFEGSEDHSPSTKGHWEKWYPGDDVVDWVGLSTFLGADYAKYQVPSRIMRWFFVSNPRKRQDEILSFARSRAKPVMIAEAAPQGFNLSRLTASPFYQRKDRSVTEQQIWQYWFADWFTYIKENRDVIRAVAYINDNWEANPLWRCDEGAQSNPGEVVPVNLDDPSQPACPGGVPWGDTRVQANPYILQRFKEAVGAPHFVKTSASEL